MSAFTEEALDELLLWGWRKDGKHKWYGDQKQKTVFEFDRLLWIIVKYIILYNKKHVFF